jgi:hypothetical protein
MRVCVYVCIGVGGCWVGGCRGGVWGRRLEDRVGVVCECERVSVFNCICVFHCICAVYTYLWCTSPTTSIHYMCMYMRVSLYMRVS